MPQSKLLHMGMQHVMPDVFPPKSHFSEDNIADQTGKTFLITGASSGLGNQMAKVLLQKGAKVYVTARSQEKAEKTATELAELTGNKQVHGLSVELGDPESIKACARQFTEKESSLDVLVNNGGVMHSDQGALSQDGHEMQFSTNVLGPWLLTELLLPCLEKAAATKKEARVVWLSSVGSRQAPKEGINFDHLREGTDAHDNDTMFCSEQYGQSKLANILLGKQQAKRYGDKGILAVSLHPGVVESPLWRNSKSIWGKMNAHVFSIPVRDGTLTQLYAATSPELTLQEDNGACLTAIARKNGHFHKMQDDDQLGDKLWGYCKQEMGKYLS